MKILAIDTSTKRLCVGLRDGAKEYEFDIDYATKLSACLTSALERVMRGAGVAPDEVDYFACGMGPGSFTGIRIGMACVKGLAWARKKPAVGVPSLDIVALNARREDGLLACVSDARRGLVYAGVYRVGGGRVKRIGPHLLVSGEELLARAQKARGASKDIILCGDGIPVIKQQVARMPGRARFLDSDYWKPQGRNLLELAGEQIAAGRSVSALSLAALYLYPKECQIRK